MIEVTGFTEGWKNYVGGLGVGSMTLGMYWNSDAASSNFYSTVAALKGMTSKCVTIIPDGYVLGNPAFSINAQQSNFNPAGVLSDALKLPSIKFQTKNGDGGPQSGWALQHGAITNTLTGTQYDDPTGAAVTAACGGFLHVWSATATDTYVIKIQHSSNGSTWVDLVTFTLNGTAKNSEQVTVASGTVNRYRRVLATRTGAAGDTLGFTVSFYHL